MRLDSYVHSKPDLYTEKLRLIDRLKRAVYKLLLIDGLVTRRREEISTQNLEMIRRRLKNKKILEIGCGTGSFLASLHSDLGCIGHGIDISGEMIAAARERNPGPTFTVMDSAKLRFDDDSFDYVVFNYVLHHVYDLRATIDEAKRVGRHVIIYESCAFGSQPLKYLSNLYWKAVDGGYQYRSLDEWQALFGWKVVDEIRGGGLVRYGMCVFERPGATEA